MSASFPLYLIVFLPLLSGVLLLALAGRMTRATAWLVSMLGLSGGGVFCGLALWDSVLPLLEKYHQVPALLKVTRFLHPRAVSDLGVWIRCGGFEIPFGLQLDTLSASFCAVTLVVALVVAIFGWGLRWSHKTWIRHLGGLNILTGAVLGFFLADNLGVAFAAWVFSGIAAALLVGFGTQESAAPRAARTAWLISRLGDTMLLLAVVVALVYTRSLSMTAIERSAWILSHPENRWVWGLKPAFVFTALLGGAALCRSAQFPFHLWLAKSARSTGMASAAVFGILLPTGPFLLLRFNVVAGRAPVALLPVAVVSGVSAVLLALAGSAQNHLRKALIYPIAAVMGLALLGICIGNLAGGALHVLLTAAAGSGLLLAAAAVEHRLEGMSDIREMGGLLRRLPWTGAVFLLGCLSLGALWPLAHFVSGRMLVQKALTLIFVRTPGIMRLKPEPAAVIGWLFVAAALLAFGLIAFALMRVFFRVFSGRWAGIDPASTAVAASDEAKRGSERNAAHDHEAETSRRTARRSLLWAPAMGLTVLGAAGVLLLGAIGLSEQGLNGFFAQNGYAGFEQWLSSSLPAASRWVVRPAFRPPGSGGLTQVTTATSWAIGAAVAGAMLVGVLLAGFFFGGGVRAVGGRLISSRLYRWFYRLLHADLGAESGLRFWSDRVLYAVGWIERGIGERLIADALLIRLPARLTELVGWAAARWQRRPRRSALSFAVAGLAVLAALAARPASSIQVESAGSTFAFTLQGAVQMRGKNPWQARWDLDGDGTWDQTGVRVKRKYRRAGAKTITVEVKDLRWKTTTRLTRKIHVKRARSGKGEAR